MIEVISIVSFPYINKEDVSIILEFLQNLIAILQSRKIKENNNKFLKFMKNCIISYFDCTFIKPSLNEFIEELTKLMNIILFDDEFINNFNYTSSAFHTYQFLFKLNKILKIIIDRNLQLCQIQNNNKIPCLLNNEIPKILSKYHILHEFIFIDNSLYDFIKLM